MSVVNQLTQRRTVIRMTDLLRVMAVISKCLQNLISQKIA